MEQHPTQLSSNEETLNSHSYSDVSDHEEEDELHKAARAGILLLEQNQELQQENTALRHQLSVMESERSSLEQTLTRQEQELTSLQEERRQSLIEINALRSELSGKSTLITDGLDREQRLKATIKDLQDHQQVLLYQYERLQTELDSVSMSKACQSVENPAALYDSSQCRAFTWKEHEELLKKYHAARNAIEKLQLELKSVRKEVEIMRQQAQQAVEAQQWMERMERIQSTLEHQNATLKDELVEERALVESLRTMNSMYKQIADSRPFGWSEQEEELETMEAVLSNQGQDKSHTTVPEKEEEEGEEKNNNQSGEGSEPPSLFVDLFRRFSKLSLPTMDNEMSNTLEKEEIHEQLLSKVQELETKLTIAQEKIQHTQHQWQTAIASQKALQACSQSAQQEITRLTQLVDYQLTCSTTSTSKTSRQTEIDEDKWVEEIVPYPAPPGDLNSPLIKCLLDHWTTDKSKIMHLTDWLHHAIRGSGNTIPLRLEQLSSEVTAGFTQLLVPMLRERHGVHVAIYRRDSVQVLSDMVLHAHPTTLDVQKNLDLSREGRSHSVGSSASVKSTSTTSSTGSSSRRRHENNYAGMNETDFLLG